MPRQNRVTPFGELIATPARGMFLGNRGVLHDGEGHIKRMWQLKRWIVCVLAFKGRKRALMTPGRYTELFFLDEATALAAGHRPCAECRRDRFNAFRRAWQLAQPETSPVLPTANEIDHRLHAERSPNRAPSPVKAKGDELPNGVFVQWADGSEDAYLVWNGLLSWTAGGYTKRLAFPEKTEMVVLTPPSTVAAIRAGYIPEIHPSARA